VGIRQSVGPRPNQIRNRLARVVPGRTRKDMSFREPDWMMYLASMSRSQRFWSCNGHHPLRDACTRCSRWNSRVPTLRVASHEAKTGMPKAAYLDRSEAARIALSGS
jgi:hypothetical protein